MPYKNNHPILVLDLHGEAGQDDVGQHSLPWIEPPPASLQGTGFAQGTTAHRGICKLGLGLHTAFPQSELKLPVCWSEAADGLGCGSHGPKCRLETLPPRFSALLFFMRPVPGHHPVRGAFLFFCFAPWPFLCRAGFFSVTEIGGVKTGRQIHTPPPFGGVGMEYLIEDILRFWIFCWIFLSFSHGIVSFGGYIPGGVA